MANSVKPIPNGMYTLTPHIVVTDMSRAIDFYESAFDGKRLDIIHDVHGKPITGSIKIGDSVLLLSEHLPRRRCQSPEHLGGQSAIIHIYTDDVDAFWSRALAAGAKECLALNDVFWGERYGQLADPFGHLWSVSSRKEDLSTQEVENRSHAFHADYAKYRAR
jgi:PhnB protein